MRSSAATRRHGKGDGRHGGPGVTPSRGRTQAPSWASRQIARLLKRRGYRLVAAPQSFLVCSHGTLLDGEASWARRWGMTLAEASRAYLPAHA